MKTESEPKDAQSNELLARTKAVQNALTRFAGIPIEITFRSSTEITLSSEGDVLPDMERIRKQFFYGAVAWEATFDPECDFTCAYVTLPTCA